MAARAAKARRRRLEAGGCFTVIAEAFILLVIFTVVSAVLFGCAGPGAAPEPRIVTVEVPRIVEVKCKDQRPAADPLPDDDAALAAVPDDDFFTLAKLYRASRDLYRARLTIDDVQIRGCAGN